MLRETWITCRGYAVRVSAWALDGITRTGSKVHNVTVVTFGGMWTHVTHWLAEFDGDTLIWLAEWARESIQDGLAWLAYMFYSGQAWVAEMTCGGYQCLKDMVTTFYAFIIQSK